jgi:hypothetical protein
MPDLMLVGHKWPRVLEFDIVERERRNVSIHSKVTFLLCLIFYCSRWCHGDGVFIVDPFSCHSYCMHVLILIVHALNCPLLLQSLKFFDVFCSPGSGHSVRCLMDPWVFTVAALDHFP